MRKTQDNIAALIRAGVPVKLNADDFRYSELESLARLAASSETAVTFVPGDNLTAAEVLDLGRMAHGHMHVDLTPRDKQPVDKKSGDFLDKPFQWYRHLYTRLLFAYIRQGSGDAVEDAAKAFHEITGLSYCQLLDNFYQQLPPSSTDSNENNA